MASNTPTFDPSGTPQVTVPGDGERLERRQMTVMFCDLVDSTSLALTLDPEDLRQIYRAYQAECTRAVNQFGGRIVRFVGDGVLCAFGHPEAHEDDPERAVRAARTLMHALRKPEDSVGGSHDRTLLVRVGVATGLAVVGDSISVDGATEWTVIGTPSHTAARLQALAAPGQMLIDEVTLSRLRGRFVVRNLGRTELKGFQDAQAVYTVESEAADAGSDIGWSAPARTPFVGRARELAQLVHAWQSARAAAGQLILIAGEPGIGKSRLLHEFVSRIGADEPYVVRLNCSPHHTHSAFYPVQRYLAHACAISDADSHDARRAKVDRFLAELGGVPAESAAAVNYLLLPPDRAPPVARMPAEQFRARAVRGLVQWLLALAARRPTILLVEDLHWIDPSSMDLLDALLRDSAAHAVLLLASYRASELDARWPAYRRTRRAAVNAHELALDKLDEPAANTLVKALSGPDTLPDEAVRDVLARSDGNPLFLEEMIAHHLATAEASREAARASRAGVPTTLATILLARLDRLGEAKRLAQLACVLGREFSLDLLQAIAALPASEFRQQVQLLMHTGLIEHRDAADAGQHAFRHQLLRDAAYESLAHSRRRTLHRAVARTLHDEFPRRVEQHPEIVAHHHSLAAEYAQAARHWRQAGALALGRSANVEAARHLRAALAELAQLPDSAQRQTQEVDALLELGPALMTTEGAGSSEVSAVYERALRLCEHLPASPRHFAARWGWWRVSMNHHTGRERGDRLLEMAITLDDPGLTLQAHHSLWATTYMLGDQPACCDHIDKGLALYDPEAHRHHADVYGGHDAKVCACGERALSCWLQGELDLARASIESSLTWAHELDHIPSLAHACDYELMLTCFSGDAHALIERCAALIDMAMSNAFPDYAAKGRFFRGWARMRTGWRAQGLQEMEQALQWLDANCTREDFPVFLEMLAEAYQHNERDEEGLRCIDAALAQSKSAGLRYWDAALHCRRGEILAHGDATARIEAGRALLQAMNTGASQQAHWLELQAAATTLRQGLTGEPRARADAALRSVLAARPALRSCGVLEDIETG